MFLQTSERHKHGNITNKRKLQWVSILHKNEFDSRDVFSNYWMFRTCVAPSAFRMKFRRGFLRVEG